MFHNHFVTLIAFSLTHVAIQSQIVASRKASSGENGQDSHVRTFRLIAATISRRLLTCERCANSVGNPANPVRRDESFLIAARRITEKEKRREAPSNPPLVSPRNNPRRAPWTSYGVWDGNSGLIDENTQSG
jgi:hypothetical protein